MEDTTHESTAHSEQTNTTALVLGLVVAIAAVGLVGRSVYDRYIQPEQRARDVKDIISQCHATIQEMDRALQRLQPSST
ncbi:MAG: hypothetical protein IT209_04345 [Armatimonadetes bacterium]|nr:hypothetical protein [Armatimonadota bacterium]